MDPMLPRRSFLPLSLLLTCLAVLHLGSCIPGQDDPVYPGPPDPYPYDDSRYDSASGFFPMAFGSIWYYSVFTISGADTAFDHALEGRMDSMPNRTHFYKMPGNTVSSWMSWSVRRASAIDAGSGVLFHTRLLDSSASYQEIIKRGDNHDQVYWGGLHPVTTPLGVFQCIRNDHRYYDADTVYQVRYFARDLGWIKEEEYRLVNGQIYPDRVRLIDSTSFK
jgi:hypothetical protein